AGVSMMVDLKVMAYFKLSLSTRNWDIAFFIVPVLAGKQLIAGCKKQRNCPEKSNLYGFVLELLIIFFANI
ncbi:hypothetical protein ACW5W8_07620, partial [Aeromonas aquatilis]